jgi:hypothetical protein
MHFGEQQAPSVIESLKAIAPLRGFEEYQTILKTYISQGLRRDEAEFER